MLHCSLAECLLSSFRFSFTRRIRFVTQVALDGVARNTTSPTCAKASNSEQLQDPQPRPCAGRCCCARVADSNTSEDTCYTCIPSLLYSPSCSCGSDKRSLPASPRHHPTDPTSPNSPPAAAVSRIRRQPPEQQSHRHGGGRSHARGAGRGPRPAARARPCK